MRILPKWLSTFLDEASSGYESEADQEVHEYMLEKRKKETYARRR